MLKAIELDPMFAEAHQLLAFHYWWIGGLTAEAAIAQKQVIRAADRALALDPTLVFAKALRASADTRDDEWLPAIEALERATREEPSNANAQDALLSYLLQTGYTRESLGLAERFIDLDPLSAPAHARLAGALFTLGRTSEAVRSLKLASELGNDVAEWLMGNLALFNKEYEAGITHIEAYLERTGISNTWVRELVTHARDPETGQAYLDKHIPKIVASVTKEEAFSFRILLNIFYLPFGFLDRYFEIIFAFEPGGAEWSNADILYSSGVDFRRYGFTTHPRYLELAETYGLIDLWEQRDPPDYCEKVGGEWVCE